MGEENAEAGKNPDDKAVANGGIDLNKFKSDIIAENKAMMGDLADQLITSVSQLTNPKAPDPKPDPDDGATADSEAEAELVSSGFDQAQAKAMIGVLDKVLDQKGDAVIKKVDQHQNFKDQRVVYTRKGFSEYPDATNKNSQLFKLAVQKFKSDPALGASPKGEYYALVEAANELGIQPTKISTAMANAAVQNNGQSVDVGASKKEVNKDVASMFGLSADQMKEANARYQQKLKAS